MPPKKNGEVQRNQKGKEREDSMNRQREFKRKQIEEFISRHSRIYREQKKNEVLEFL